MPKPEYTHPEHKKFVRDMTKAGLEVQLYHGRFWYHGPSVTVKRLQDALSHTKVRCSHDQLGLWLVVHPSASDAKLVPDA